MKTYTMKINGEKYETKIKKYKFDKVIVEVNGIDYEVELEEEHRRKSDIVRSNKTQPALDVVKKPAKPTKANPGAGLAPLPGLVLQLPVKEGDEVKEGDPVIILEAMKMESEIASTATGKVIQILIKEGASVQEGDVLIEVGA